jgi:predicted dehydrogenase
MTRLAALIRSGAIGEVRSIRSTFSFAIPFDPGSRLFDPALGGGSILDVGCYPASMSRFIAGAAADTPFAEPVSVKATGLFAPSGVDTFTAATLAFPGGMIAELVCGFSCQMPVETTVFGTNGRLALPNPWLPSSPARRALKPLPAGTRWPSEKILLWEPDQDAPTEIVVDADRDLYSYEADTVDEHIPDRQSPAMSWDDSLGNMRLLDRWRAELDAGGSQAAEGASPR